MKEIIGDFWKIVQDGVDQNKEPWDAICCTTNSVIKSNGELVMGAGIAKDFARKFPQLPMEWGQRLKIYSQRNSFYESFFYPPILISQCLSPYNTLNLVSFPTKNDWRAKSEISLITKSAISLVNISDALGWDAILLTRPGCGMGGLNWENEVKPVIKSYFDNRFVIVNKEK